MQSPHQPGIGLKPGSQTLPANVLQVVKQVQEESARQQAPHGGYGEVNPGDGVPGQNMPPPLMHMEPGQGGNLLPMDQWYRYIGGTDQGPQLAQAQGQLSADHMPQANQAGRQTMSQMFLSRTNVKQALQQLVTVLKSPQTPEQQQQILQIVKSNPQLKAAFMKQRQNRAEHTLAQAQGQLSADHMPQANQAGRQTISQMFPSGTNNKQALQQLVMVLKSPQTPEQQQQILQILKSNPQLMTAFIKLRQKMSIDILDVTLSPTTKGWFNQRFREVLQDDQEHWDNTSHNLGRVPRHPRMQCCHPMSKLQDEPIMSSWKTFQVHLKRFKSIQHARRGNLKQTSSLLLQEERRKTSYSCKTQEPRQNPSFKVRRSWTGPLQDVTSYLQPTRQDSYYLCTRIFDLFTI